MRDDRGFTLVEMVVAITISAILMGTIAMIMSRPLQSYVEQSRRSQLVDTSDRIGRMLGNDLAKALPNSVRIDNVGNVKVVQMLEVSDVLYYKQEPLGATPAQAAAGLKFTAADTLFDAYGSFTSNSSLLVINDMVGAAYGAGGVISADTSGAQAFGTHSVTLAPAFQFPNGSSSTNRLFAINKSPITYVCNLASGILTRFTDHARNAAMPADETDAQLNSPGSLSSVLATGVTACAFQCSLPPGNPCQRTLTFAATVTRGTAPDIDRIEIMRQFGVENTP